MENRPEIQAVFISREMGGEMERVYEAVALEGLGLEGDRYAKHEGFWQNTGKRTNVVRDVSLIKAEDIEGSSFLPEETRRNLVVVGEIDLLDLIGQEFAVGEVRLLGIEECTPCKRPSELSSKEGFAKEFKGKGGIRAGILTWGTIREGDPIVRAGYENEASE